MVHEVENMFSVKVTPWHGLGVIIQDAPSIEEVLKVAGLDWNVGLQPMFLDNKTEVSQKAIVRESDNSVLGFCSERYKPFQNTEMLNFFRSFHESKECTFETAGSLRGGQKVWILAALNRANIDLGGGDQIRKYLLLSNAHDGKTGIRVGLVPIRVVCANTLALAHNSEQSKLMRVFHSSKTVANLELLRDTINLANQEFEATAEQYKLLTTRQVNQHDVRKYIKILFYNDVAPESDRSATIQDKMINNVIQLFEVGKGSNLSTAKGTAWGMYNAVTEYMSYEAGRNQDNRLNNLWFGQGVDLNKTALSLAVKLVA